MLMRCERAVTDVPLSCAPSPISMAAPGPNTRRRTGAYRLAAVARRREEIRLARAPMRMLPPGQRNRPTGPWARVPGPTATPSRAALQRRRTVPQNAPQSRMLSRQT